jgi:hypothetical protein
MRRVIAIMSLVSPVTRLVPGRISPMTPGVRHMRVAFRHIVAVPF